MEFKKLMTAVAILGVMSFGATTASAKQGANDAFNAHYVTDAGCLECHDSNGNNKTALGNAWKSAGGTQDAGPKTASGWATLDATYETAYGGIESTWTEPAAVAPSDDGGGCVTSTLATPLMMVLTMLTLGFFVRRRKG